MDPYLSSLLLGVVGLGAMALSGLGIRGSHGGSHSHGPAAGRGHGAPAHAGHGAQARGGRIQAQTTTSTARGGQHVAGVASRTFWLITSPRFLFSFLLGLGTAGLIARPFLGGPLLLGAAVAGAVLFERVLVTPLWNLSMRFASAPAATLESAISDEATAVTTFDVNGQGIVSLEVDGQIVQILATLQPGDRILPGARVRAGQKVRVEDIDAEKNCCTVSLI